MNEGSDIGDVEARVRADGYCRIRRLVEEQRLADVIALLEDIGAHECRKLGVDAEEGRALEAALRFGGQYRESLFLQIKNLLVIRAIANDVISALDRKGLFSYAGFAYPSIFTTLKADLPGESCFDLPYNQDYKLTRSHLARRLWVPLSPVSATNGTMELIPGTHRDSFEYQAARGTYAHILERDLSRVGNKLAIEMPAGDGIVFDPWIVHRSVPNTGRRIRLVMILQIQDIASLYDPTDEHDPIRRFVRLSTD